MSVLILDNRRIFLNGIVRYELGSDALYYRNDKEEESFLFIWLINDDELWSKYSFEYLYIKMRDGMSYKIFSDKKLYNLMKEMAYYFEESDINSDEEIFEEDEHLRKAFKSYVRIKDTFIFVSENISYITNKIDNAFGTI